MKGRTREASTARGGEGSGQTRALVSKGCPGGEGCPVGEGSGQARALVSKVCPAVLGRPAADRG